MRRPHPVVTALLTGTLLSGVLAGCGQQTGTDEAASTGSAPAAGEVTSAPSSAPSVPSTSSAAPVASSASDGGAPPFPGDTSADTAEPVAPEGLVVTDVRIGAHAGHDQVVLDVAGEGTPGWEVQYVDVATAEGTGDPIDLAGPAYLRVVLTGVTNPYESEVAERPLGAVTAPGTTAVTGAWYDGTFEGQALAYLGTTAERPFRVYALSGPTRVVIEVAGD
jgi:hypothetical protein